MAYLAGNYDPANPPSDTGPMEAPRQSEDLAFSPGDVKNDEMDKGDMDDMSAMIGAIGGEDQPAIERSGSGEMRAPAGEKRVEDMTLAEQMAYQSARLRKKDDKPADDKPAEPVEKRVEDMTLAEQMAY